MGEVLRHPLEHAMAGLAVLVAATRVGLWQRLVAFDDLVARLRCSPAWMGGRVSPRAQLRMTNGMLRLLPPWGMGPCLKRSLILLHLWSTRGLNPRLHLGVRGGDAGAREGHAWLTVDDPEISRLSGAPAGAAETVVL